MVRVCRGGPSSTKKAITMVSEFRTMLVDGEPVDGPQLVHVTNGTALLTVTGRSVVSQILSYDCGLSMVELDMEADCTASRWSELSFGRSVLEHAVA